MADLSLRRNILPPQGFGADHRVLRVMLGLFVVVLMIPVTMTVGGRLWSPLRIYLLCMSLPLVWAAIHNWPGRLRPTDVALFSICLWIPIALFANHGLSELNFTALTVLEILVPYLLGRLLIRDEDSYRRLLGLFALALAFLLPLALTEAIWKVQPLRPVALALGDTYPWRLEERLGLWRAQTVFPHPILFGLFSVGFLAPFIRAGTGKGWAAALAMTTTFLSLSAGAWLAAAIQIGLLIWARTWRGVSGHWWVLSIGVAFCLFVAEVASNRTVIELLADTLSMNAHNAHWRLLIFEFVVDDVQSNPLFGIGLHEWSRPHWMARGSVDNFWLLQALRYGMPGLALFALMYLFRLRSLFYPCPSFLALREGAGFALIGLGAGLGTVHIWGEVFVVYIFILGATGWFSEEPRPR